MRGGTLLIWLTGSKVKVNFGTLYKTLWTRFRLQFLPNHFQTSHVSCGWWEEEPYWFGFTGSKVKVNFVTLCTRPCGQDTDYSFCPITFKLHSQVSYGWWEEEPYWFRFMGSKVKVNIGTLCIRPYGHNTDFTCKLWMMRGGLLLIWGHGVKGQDQHWHSVYKALGAQCRLQFVSNHVQTSHVGYGWWGQKPYWIWVTGS